MSPDGANKDPQQAGQHASQINKIIKAVGGLNNLFDKTKLWKEWLQPFEESQKRPGTIKAYLVSLKHLFTFMINEEIYLGNRGVDHGALLRLTNVMRGWMKVYQKKCDMCFWENQQEDLHKLTTPEEMKQFDVSEPARKAVKLFERLQGSHFRLRYNEYVLLSDYLISYLCLNNGSRTGAIAWMRKDNVKKAVHKNGSMAVSVLWHKTVRKSGPAILSMEQSVYNRLGIFVDKVRPRFLHCQEMITMCL